MPHAMLVMPIGTIEICTFPMGTATSFSEFPHGRIVVGDKYSGDVLYYIIDFKKRNNSSVALDYAKHMVRNNIEKYVTNLYGSPQQTFGWKSMMKYVEWLINPELRPNPHCFSGGSINKSPEGQFINLMRLELPSQIFFRTMTTVKTMHEAGAVEEITAEDFDEELYHEGYYGEVRALGVQEAFFGTLLFGGNDYFFTITGHDLSRWNPIPHNMTDPEWPKNTLATGMHKDDVVRALKDEIYDAWSFLEGTDLLTDIKVIDQYISPR